MASGVFACTCDGFHGLAVGPEGGSSATGSAMSATIRNVTAISTGISMTASTGQLEPSQSTTAITGSASQSATGSLHGYHDCEPSLVLSKAASFSDATEYRLDGTRLIDASMGKVWTYAGGPGSSIYMFTQADPSQPTYELSCSFRTGDTLSCFAPNNPAINLLEVVTYAQPYGDILWIGDDLFYQFKAKSYKFVCAGGNSNMPTCADFLLMVFDDSADPDNGSPELNCQFASDGTLSCFDPVFPHINQLQTVSYGSVVGNALFIAEQGKVADAVDRQYKYICPAPSQPATTTKPAASAPTCGGDGRFRLMFGDASYLQNIPLYVYATDNPDQATRSALKGTTLVDPSNYDPPWLTGMSAGNGPVDAGLPHSAPEPNRFVPVECSLREGFELYCQHPFSNGAIHDLQFCTDGAYGNLLLLANGPFVAGLGCEPIVLTAECVTPPG
ncbi:uncharacterized protein MYCGRDRAFT_96877 [Zymoseptoria tritici IPO323]|uniref:Uncharacterized protein n=1 Tax=Zymoseptoria tritici (strain CBS 115943 / IPO323) TaxID=336722 RepID=F9XPC9_ZYMTI|nr:uncharacterized protein MYCGRDRAFT_96877 [Zymoseptoria tritici IPO323]EGP82821.1 hypothetical protein MYCGRDRAFT_96877 [Zymoseptoria tritici IPO323]